MAYSAQSGHIDGDMQAALAGSRRGSFLLTLKPDWSCSGSSPAMAPYCLACISSGFTKELNGAGVGDAGDAMSRSKVSWSGSSVSMKTRVC